MAEKKVIELEVKAESLGSLKSQLRQAQADVTALSEKFGATSQEAINAAKKAAALKDAIGDAKALTDAYNPDAKFNALSQSLTGVLDGFQAFQGALGLVGVESKDVEEALLKVNSAMALAQGVSGVLESIDSFKTLATQVRNLTIVQKISTAAQWLWNAAMNANPLGAIVIAITAVIAAGYKLISFFQESAAENEKHEKSIKKRTEALKKEQAQMEASSKRQEEYNNFQYEYAKAAGASSEQLRKLAIRIQEKKIALAESNKEQAKATYLLQQDILASMIANDADEERIEKQKELVKEARENATKTREIATQEKVDLINLKRQQLVEIRQEQTDANKKEQEDAKEAADKAKERRKEAADKEKEERERQNKERFDAEQKANEERIAREDAQYALELSLLKDNKEKEKQELINSYDEKYAVANGNAELEKQLAEQLNTELAAINKKYADEEAAKKEALRQKELDSERGFLEARIIQNANDFQARLDLLELQREKELQNKELTEGEIAAIEAKYSAERKKISEDEAAKKQENQQKALNAAKQSLQGIADLAALFAGRSEKEQKKAFAVQKAANIANATMDTFSSAQAAYKSVVGVPVVGPALAIAAAAAAVAAGLLNIKKISATKFESNSAPSPSSPSGSGASSGGAGASNVIAPNFNIVGNTQATNPLAGLGGQPIKAYVVSGEVTTAQSLDRNRVDFATF